MYTLGMRRGSSRPRWQRVLALAGILVVLPLGLCFMGESDHHSAELCFAPSSACAMVAALVPLLLGLLAASGQVMMPAVRSVRTLPLRFPDPPPKSRFLL